MKAEANIPDQSNLHTNRRNADADHSLQGNGQGVLQKKDDPEGGEDTDRSSLKTIAPGNPEANKMDAYQQMANKSSTVKQLKTYQKMADTKSGRGVQRKDNKNGGLPSQLKKGVEQLSGTSMNDVTVHYNSSQPAQFKALAYAQGTEIHIAPGQEQHLPHEAWHVAQQKQGRVQATTQLKGASVNDDASLESEADSMGAKAISYTSDTLASGYENISRQDIGDISAQSSLVGTVQKQQLENINGEIGSLVQQLNNSDSISTAQRKEITQMVSGKLIIDDGEVPAKNQVTKNQFLSLLRAQIQTVSAEVMSPLGLAQSDCPDLNYWMTFYAGKDAMYIEKVVSRYAPGTAAATNGTEFISLLTEQVRANLVDHVTNDRNKVDPGEVPSDIEEKRTDRSVLTLQKKEAPIQFGCLSSCISNCTGSSTDKKKTGESKKESKGVEIAKAKAIPMVTDPEDIYRQVMAAIAEGDEVQKCIKVGKICGFDYTADELTSPAAISGVYEMINTCGAVQAAIVRGIFAKDGVKALNAMNTDDASREDSQDWSGFNKLTADTVSAFLAEMATPGKVAIMNDPRKGKDHCFTLASAKRPVAPESKDGHYFLFQGWVDTHTLLDSNYTKQFDKAEFATFVDQLTKGKANVHFAHPVDSFVFIYRFIN